MSSAPLQVISANAEPVTEEAALAEAKTLQPIQLNATVLAARWGWHRSRVQRRLARWSKQGLIEKPVKGKAGAKKKATNNCPWAKSARNVVRLAPERDLPTGGPVAAAAAFQPAENAKPAEETSAQANDNKRADREVRGRVSIERILFAIILFIASLTLGIVGLLLNMTTAYSYGRSADAAQLLAAEGIVVDVLAMILPAIVTLLWRRNKLAAVGTAAIFVGVLTMSLQAACTFAATNIGDSVQGRAKVAIERAAVTAKLQQQYRERGAISEMRSTDEIDVAIQMAQPLAAKIWKRSNECWNVTKDDSGKGCEGVNILREARGAAVRRHDLDLAIGENEKKLAELPAFAAADPGADMAVKIVAIATGGYITTTSEMVQQVRVAGLTIMPAFCGLLLSVASLLWRPAYSKDRK